MRRFFASLLALPQIVLYAALLACAVALNGVIDFGDWIARD